MLELNDENTDKFFRVNAEQHDFDFNPAAWEQMEEMLDRDDLLISRRKKLLFGGGLLLLALLGVTWFFLRSPEASIPTKTQPVYAQEATQEPNAPTATAATAADAPTEASTADETVAGDRAEKAVATASTGRSLSPARGGVGKAVTNQTNTGGDKTSKRPSAAVNDLASTGKQPNERQSPATVPAPSVTPEVDNTAPTVTEAAGRTEKITNDEATMPVYRDAIVITPLASSPAVAQMVGEREVPVTEVNPDPAAVPEFHKARPASGFAISLSAGIISGMVTTENPGPVDVRLGGTLDYRISDKFSVGSGAYFNKVCYGVEGSLYKARNGFFEVTPESVMADCDILEVPLNVTWHPWGSSQSGPYLSAGVSSYFMMVERFDFKYNVPDDNLIKKWREDDTNKHLFGVGQVRLGYQQKASRRSAFQVESFLQLPFTGLGHGQVEFFSVGASVNYTFDFRRMSR